MNNELGIIRSLIAGCLLALWSTAIAAASTGVHKPSAAATGSGAGAPAGSATAAPPAQPPAGRATDPQPGANRCTGYTLDGIVLGMPRSDVDKIGALFTVPASESLLQGLEKSTLGLRARRQGRFDDIQIGFDPEGSDPKVQRLRARILVMKDDPWPRSLFDLLGSPKRARVGEWIWWDQDCSATLRLTRVDPLGGGQGQPYILEIARTASGH